MRKRNVSGRKMGVTVCQNCKKEFEKPLSEIIRNKKFNRPNFCCRSCVGKHNFKNFGDKRSSHHTGKADIYSKFRYHFRAIQSRSREKGHEINVTMDDLIEQWNTQKGICEFSGIELILSSYSKIIKDPIYSASLDRIDSNKGYIKGNIRWISRSINWMKNEMSDEMTWKLCELISENIKNRKLYNF